MSSYFENMVRNMPPVTKNLILVNLLIFLVMAIIPESKSVLIDKYCALHYYRSPLFNPAQLFTYMFLHAGFTHVFFNMFTLFMFGPMIEWAINSRRFLFFYISCGVGAALIQEGVYAVMFSKYAGMFTPDQLDYYIKQGSHALLNHQNYIDPTLANLNALVNGPTVGASGAIYGVLLAFGMLYPEREIMLLIPPIPIKAKWMVLGFGVIEIFLGLNGGDNVAHFCHLGGMIVGFVIIYYWKKKGTFNGFY